MSERLLQVRGLTVRFELRRTEWLGPRRTLTAVAGVDLEVDAGQAVGVVGESGCGKSTLARAVLALLTPHAGTIEWCGRAVRRGDAAGLARMRRELQVVFQDPVGSLDPRMTIGESVAEALEALAAPTSPAAATARIAGALHDVGLDPALAHRYPHELSGGQCQRAAIARAVVARPRLLVCDEVVSALDVSVQAQIVNLLGELRRRHGLALLFISHNLAVVRHLCDEVIVLYRGAVVERAPRAAIFATPRHPYTRALLAAVPQPDPDALVAAVAPADPGEAVPGARAWGWSAGCAYSGRCPVADARCRDTPPTLEDTGEGRFIACHHWRTFSLTSENNGLPPLPAGR